MRERSDEILHEVTPWVRGLTRDGKTGHFYTIAGSGETPFWLDILLRLNQKPTLDVKLLGVYDEILRGFDAFRFELGHMGRGAQGSILANRWIEMQKEMNAWLTQDQRVYRSHLLE